MRGHRSASATPPHLRPLPGSGSKLPHSIEMQEVLAECRGSPDLDQASQTPPHRSRHRCPIHGQASPRTTWNAQHATNPAWPRGLHRACPRVGHTTDVGRRVQSSSPCPPTEIPMIRSRLTCRTRCASRAAQSHDPHLTDDVARQRLRCQSTLGFAPLAQVLPTTS
jgi:hypothetical protein